MFIVFAERGQLKWISGIFREAQQAKNYLEIIPEELKEYQRLVRLDHIEYPFYIIETKGFSYLSKIEVIELLNSTSVSDDEDQVHFNIYRIDSDYRPKKPGTDYMGILRHDHVTNDFLRDYKKAGMAFLINRRIM
ncbi:hypothetical protein [Paenibacillus xylanilyticus]|uniref:hypothetical protein n=1 Tax=Paenibacillus xylanilyticus TaxID=248903 RepID=UPI00399F2DDE